VPATPYTGVSTYARFANSERPIAPPKSEVKSMAEENDRATGNALYELRDALRHFAAERNWDQFHSPKNLAMALSVEVAELMEHFQWLTEEGSKNLSADQLGAVREELADVLIYLVRLADKLDVDLIAAARDKMVLNARKYPADEVRGSSRKYTQR
jgi:dCTP diphosphatase